MMRQWRLVAGVAVILAHSAGCMTCGHSGYHHAREAGPECELPVCQRNGVYVFAMSSLNPVSVLALDGLREQLNSMGFAKVASGQTIHAGWMAREMRRIRDLEPEAQFVVIGLESAAPVAVRLAERAAAEGLAIGGVVVIDSTGSAPPQSSLVRVLAVGPGEAATTTETAAAPNVATYGLASDERTIEAVAGLLNEAAGMVPIAPMTVAAEWTYPHAPPMRQAGDPALHPEWAFLFDDYPAVTVAAPGPAPPESATPTTPLLHSGGIFKSAIR